MNQIIKNKEIGTIEKIYLLYCHENNTNLAIPYIGFHIKLKDKIIDVIKPDDEYHATIYKNDKVIVETTEYRNFDEHFIKEQINILYCDETRKEKDKIINKCLEYNIFIGYELIK